MAETGPDRGPGGYPHLLLLHAAGMDSGSWDPVIRRIPGFLRVSAIDLPGHGDTPGFAYGTHVVDELAEHVAARISALGLDRPHVVGHSLGGAVALELARRVPVAAVTAFCPIGFWVNTHARYHAAKLRAMARLVGVVGPRTRARLLRNPLVRRMVLADLSARPAAIRAADAAADVTATVRSDAIAVARRAWRYSFGRPEAVTAPVMLVWAKRDRVVPMADSVRALERLPQARHLVIPDSGHMVMRDDPDGMAAIIYALSDQVVRGRSVT